MTDELPLGVSYDDKTTYQQKVEFANARGLGGLMIWAIDQDDERYTALESVLGKDIDPGVDLSPTKDSDRFSLSLCMYTKCGGVCPDDTKAMVSGRQSLHSGLPRRLWLICSSNRLILIKTATETLAEGYGASSAVIRRCDSSVSEIRGPLYEY